MDSGFTQRGLRGSSAQISRGGRGFPEELADLLGSSLRGVIVGVLLRLGVRVRVLVVLGRLEGLGVTEGIFEGS